MKKILSVCVLSSLLCLSVLAGPPGRYGVYYYGGPRPCYYGPGYYGPPGWYYGPPRSGLSTAVDIVNLVNASICTVGAIVNPRRPVVIAQQPAPVYVQPAPVYVQQTPYVYPAPAQRVYVQPAAPSSVVVQQPVGESELRQPTSITIQPDGTRIIRY